MIRVCDVCGDHPCATRSYVVDRKTDAAGSMEDEAATFDLCPQHELEALRFFLSKYTDFSLNREVAQYLEKRIDQQKTNKHKM